MKLKLKVIKIKSGTFKLKPVAQHAPPYAYSQEYTRKELQRVIEAYTNQGFKIIQGE